MKVASPLHARSLFLFFTAATPAGTTGRLSTTECTYLPAYLSLCSTMCHMDLIDVILLRMTSMSFSSMW